MNICFYLSTKEKKKKFYVWSRITKINMNLFEVTSI